MAVYNLSPIFDPQYVPSVAGKLTFATPSSPTVVPASYNYQISVCRVANNSGSPVSLEIWRVPSGDSADNQHIVVPSINVPAASQTFPWFDVTALWGVVLQPGDAIYAVAGTASALVIQADGVVVQI
jgi:hypothetical protein